MAKLLLSALLVAVACLATVDAQTRPKCPGSIGPISNPLPCPQTMLFDFAKQLDFTRPGDTTKFDLLLATTVGLDVAAQSSPFGKLYLQYNIAIFKMYGNAGAFACLQKAYLTTLVALASYKPAYFATPEMYALGGFFTSISGTNKIPFPLPPGVGPFALVQLANSVNTGLVKLSSVPSNIPLAQVLPLVSASNVIARNMEPYFMLQANKPKSEPLEKPFGRIRANVAPTKPKDKRAKKARQEEAPAPPAADVVIELYSDAAGQQPIDASAPNGEAWLQGRLLRIGNDLFDVVCNPPTVESIRLPGWPMAGYPILPTYSLAFADEALCGWRWFRRGTATDRASSGDAEGWQEINNGNRPCYAPTPEDIGCHLRVECTPTDAEGRQGEAAAAATATAVVQGPQLPAARVRQLGPAQPTAPGALRVLSYNILADQYASTDYAQEVLFGYCPTPLLSHEYRRQLVLEELMAYQADIMCMQEVDDKVFGEYLLPHLRRAGFAGHYSNKAGKVREGSATFWREGRFRAVSMHTINLRECFKQPLPAQHAHFGPMLDASPALAEALQKVTTIAQFTLLVPTQSTNAGDQSSTSSMQGSASSNGSSTSGSWSGADAEAPLVVVNTHLFFHPYAPHIRTMHTAAIIEEAATLLQQCLAKQPELAKAGSPALLFCGDLNSDLNDGVPGVVELLQTGHLPADHWDWEQGAGFSWGKDEEEEDVQAVESVVSPQQQQGQQQQEEGHLQGQQHQEELLQQQQQRQQQRQPVSAPGVAPVPAPPPRAPATPLAVTGIDLTMPYQLRSADDLATPYTNYTSGYKALLDYVWYEPGRLAVTRQLPVPFEQLLSSFIPSPNFPSDHLAVVYDFAWRRPSSTGANVRVVADGQQPGVQGAAPPPTALQAAAPMPVAAGAAEPQRHAAGAFLLLPALADHVADAVAALRRSEVIGLPTDTLYGLAAAADDDAAVAILAMVKGRVPDAPMAICIADVADVARYSHADHLPPGLLQALLPGPVTLLLPRRGDALLAQTLNPGVASIGVRMPQQEFARAVCRALGAAVVLTSANPSGAGSTLEVAEFRDMWQYCGAVFDGGRIPVSRAEGSTIIDLTTQPQARIPAAKSTTAATVPFRIVRRGVAADGVVELLTKAFGMQQHP